MTGSNLEALWAVAHLSAVCVPNPLPLKLVHPFSTGLSQLTALAELRLGPSSWSIFPQRVGPLPNLRSLSMEPNSNLDQRAAYRVLMGLTGLQDLVCRQHHWTSMDYYTHFPLGDVVRALTGLTKLEMRGLSFYPCRYRYSLLSGLRHLVISFLQSSGPHLEEMLRSLPSLRHLEFSWDNCSTDLGGALQGLP
jgi:hypothetical protein